MSRIGKKPLAVPKDTKIEVKDNRVEIQGPKGKLNFPLSSRLTVEVKDSVLTVGRVANTKLDRSLHGTARSIISGMIKGVTEGYVKELEIIGVGWRASMQGNDLNLQLGYSHPVVFPAPEGIKIEAPKQTQIVIRGIDKEKVGEVAAEIRLICPPEPYKGKGIRYTGEKVKKKIGKAQATTK